MVFLWDNLLSNKWILISLGKDWKIKLELDM